MNSILNHLNKPLIMINRKLYAEIEKMNPDDLRQLNSYVVALIKESRMDKAYEVKNKLRVYDSVKVNSPKVRGMVGQVTEINRTRCKVKFGNQSFNVPLSMVEIVK
jgi:transcription antitermination factor NusG